MLSHRNCLLLAALSLARAAPVTISNTVPRRDTDGDIISAGDGCISYQPYEKTYYLFGAHYQPCEEPNNDCYSGAPGEGVCHNVGWVPEGTCCGWRNATIAAWSSPDLVTWRKEGLNVLPLATANPASPLSSNWGAIFEPCGVYNRLTDSWTLFFLRDGYTLASAVARTPAGPFSVLQWTVPVPGFKTIVDFYFWQDVASGRLLMKHNGGGGESVVVWDEFYFAINQSSAIFGKELGYTEGGGVFEHDGDTYVMAGYGCCFCTLGSNGFLWRSSDGPTGDYSLLGDFVARNPDHSSVTHAQQFSVTPVYTTSGVVPMFIGIRFGSAPDFRKDHDFQFWAPLTFNDTSARRMDNVTWIDSFTLDLAPPPPPTRPPPPPAPWYACSFDLPGTCFEVPAGAPGASASAAACEAACVPEYVCSHIHPGTCVPLPPGVVPGAFASCAEACAPAFACSRDTPGTCTSVPNGTPGAVATLAACEATCVYCDLSGSWAGSDKGVRIDIVQRRVNATAGAVTVSTVPAVWASNATGWARPGVLELRGGWGGGSAPVGPAPGSGTPCGFIDWGSAGGWTRLGNANTPSLSIPGSSCDASTPRIARASLRLAAAVASRSWEPLPFDISVDAALPPGDGYVATLDSELSLSIEAATCNGVANGLHRTADTVYACPPSADLRACMRAHPRAVVHSDSSGAAVVVREVPAFAARFYSDQGQMLDAPDRGFYLPSGALNVSRVSREASTLRALVPMLQEHGFNAFIFEASGIEDFISYNHLGNGSEVYALGDAHRARTDAWQAQLAPFVSSLAADGISPYMMLFDLMYPPALARVRNITSVDSPDLLPVLIARFRELFERLPALEGLLIYVTDSWFPRAGYEFAQLWTSLPEMARTASIYYEALAAAAPGKTLIFSLWIPTTPIEDAWGVFSNHTPTNLTVMVNDGQGDFLWSHGINDILARGAARDRRLAVASDAYRQYDGWGRLLSSPSEQWAQRLRVAANTSAWGAFCFAEWSPGNTWPDSASFPTGELLNWTEAKGYKSWVGHWDRFRISQLRDSGLFSPSEANVAILSRLFWDPSQSPLRLLADWARAPPLSLNSDAADLLAAAFNVSGDGWMAKYLSDVDEYAVEWSIVFTPKYAPNPESTGSGLASLFANASLPQLLAANARISAAFASAEALVQQALVANGTAALAAPAAAGGKLSNARVAAAARAHDPAALGAALALAAQKTRDHAALFANFRLVAWLNHSLVSGVVPLHEACAEMAPALSELEVGVPEFGLLYPEESTAWNVASPDPVLDVRPYFFRLEDRCYADWLPHFRQEWHARCAAMTPLAAARRGGT